MRNLYHLAVFATLLVVSLSLPLDAQKLKLSNFRKSTDELAAKLQNSKYGEILQILIEKVGINRQDAQALFAAFDAILKSLQQLIDQENEGHHNATIFYNEVKTLLEGVQAEYTQNLNSQLSDLNENLLPLETRLQSSIESTQKEIEERKQQLINLDENQEKSNQDFKDQSKRLNELIATVDKALGILEGLAGGPAPAAGAAATPAFLQMENFFGAIRELEQKSKHLKSPYKPLIVALIKISERGDNQNSESTAKIVLLLNKIRAQLVAQLENLEKENNAGREAYTKAKDALEQLLKTLNTKLLADDKTLSETRGKISVAQNAVKEMEAEIDNIKKAGEEFEGYWKEAVAQHEKFLANCQEEIQLVKKAIQVCKESGISPPVLAQQTIRVQSKAKKSSQETLSM
eukprot:TRINITY_DN0_c448_g1_i6.p1 TRINITY_DN0_c448_g1~~TRINITY_DN0_c448_g1_i6.p1  ORF type:complete len:404 (+),score=149.67 TRINITY_DN0_c448_g1_i6:61-1272(+)